MDIVELQSLHRQLKKTKPIVLSLTNFVTMDFIANSLLALGAAPIMSVEDAELNELIQISNALYINIGTLSQNFIKRVYKAIEIANHKKIPIVFDPVGAGASQIRTQNACEIMPYAQIIRGNASEIMALTNHSIKTAGVESTQSTNDAKQSATDLAKKLNCTIAVSGQEDFITDGLSEESQLLGSALMPMVTGMGCTLTAVIAAFAAITPNYFDAARMACAYFGLCGSLTEAKAPFPGSFRTLFIDEIYKADFNAMKKLGVL